MDRFSTSSEILFHGLPSKSKRPSIRKQIVTVNSIVFTKQASAERYLANIFCQYFCEILENFAANHKNVSKTFRKFSKKKQKKHLSLSLILVKLQAFTEAATGGVL